MLSVLLLVAAGLSALYLLLLWTTSPSYSSDEPRPIPHKLPWLGHALDYSGHDSRSFLERSKAKANDKPWSMLIAGRKHYFITSLKDIALVHRNSKTLDMGNFLRLLQHSLFGMSNAEADSWLPVRPLAHQINSKHLLSEANNAVTAAKYFNTLYEQVNKREKKIKFDDDRAFVQDGFDTALDLLGTATTVAYFGQKLSDVNPLLMNDLTTWVSEGFWPMLAGSPRWLYPRPYKARDRLIQNIRELAKDVESDPTITSPFFAAKFKEEREFGLSNETVVKDLLSVLFGVTANSVPTAYVGLLRILTTPGLVKGLRAELAAANFSTTAPDHHTTTFPAAFPLLRSVFWETLRVHNTSGTIREVIVPTEFESSSGETYSFKTGGVVTFQSGLLHMDPKIHPDPTAFRPQRFMIKELGGEGEDEKKTLKPFGGGVSYCPGRIFAEKQIMAYWAVLIWRFEMEIVNNEGKEKWQFPNNSDFYDVAKSKRATICFRMRDGC